MGGGRLDAGKAVEMAYKMAQPPGVIKIKNRDFYRNRTFEFKNAPYDITIENQKFRDSVKADFIARNYIGLKNALLSPNSNGNISIAIDPSALSDSPRLKTAQRTLSNKKAGKSSFSDGKTFQLKYFLKNGIRENIDLRHPYDPVQTRSTPSLLFTLNTNGRGYCNSGDIQYTVKEQLFYSK